MRSFHAALLPADAMVPSMEREQITAQFPQWAKLPLTPVGLSGWDNMTFRLGYDLAVRMPTAETFVSSPAYSGRHSAIPPPRRAPAQRSLCDLPSCSGRM